MLRISVPEELIKSELRIYNYMGQLMYHTIMEQTEEMVQVSSKSNFYIVVVQSGSEYISKKFIVF